MVVLEQQALMEVLVAVVDLESVSLEVLVTRHLQVHRKETMAAHLNQVAQVVLLVAVAVAVLVLLVQVHQVMELVETVDLELHLL